MSAALYDSGVDTATILIDMVRIRPIPLDFTKCAVGVMVLAVFDLYCFLADLSLTIGSPVTILS
jgi:hypothetical protein